MRLSSPAATALANPLGFENIVVLLTILHLSPILQNKEDLKHGDAWQNSIFSMLQPRKLRTGLRRVTGGAFQRTTHAHIAAIRIIANRTFAPSARHETNVKRKVLPANCC